MTGLLDQEKIPKFCFVESLKVYQRIHESLNGMNKAGHHEDPKSTLGSVVPICRGQSKGKSDVKCQHVPDRLSKHFPGQFHVPLVHRPTPRGFLLPVDFDTNHHGGRRENEQPQSNGDCVKHRNRGVILPTRWHKNIAESNLISVKGDSHECQCDSNQHDDCVDISEILLELGFLPTVANDKHKIQGQACVIIYGRVAQLDHESLQDAGGLVAP
mmetsp:Transcript_1171/g.3015  ORF Transcript_1171/g.3015 Transcript_1171/m.3015 type:complete len:214 (+) Transcript_1171:1662-2303(+)